MPSIEQAKEEMCEIGRRIYARGFVAANEGNLSYRVDEDRVLCTPTMFCKGFLKPEDIATVDFEGNQTDGARPRSSEVLMHLQILKARSDVNAIVHCHPPHATAFALAGEPIPAGLIPEVEIFLGEVPTAPYALPSTPALGESILPLIDRTNIVLMANHGTVSFGETIERAYWWTEILDNYCKTLIHAKSLGEIQQLTKEEALELIANKGRWNMTDPRSAPEFVDVDPRTLPLFRKEREAAGLTPTAFRERPFVLTQSVLENLIESIVERVVEQTRGQDTKLD